MEERRHQLHVSLDDDRADNSLADDNEEGEERQVVKIGAPGSVSVAQPCHACDEEDTAECGQAVHKDDAVATAKGWPDLTIAEGPRTARILGLGVLDVRAGV